MHLLILYIAGKGVGFFPSAAASLPLFYDDRPILPGNANLLIGAWFRLHDRGGLARNGRLISACGHIHYWVEFPAQISLFPHPGLPTSDSWLNHLKSIFSIASDNIGR